MRHDDWYRNKQGRKGERYDEVLSSEDGDARDGVKGPVSKQQTISSAAVQPPDPRSSIHA